MELTEKLSEEAKKAWARKDTLLHSRLHDAKREIEYFRWALDSLSALEDRHIVSALRQFMSETHKGNKIGMAHPLLRPDEVMAVAKEIIRRRKERANV